MSSPVAARARSQGGPLGLRVMRRAIPGTSSGATCSRRAAPTAIPGRAGQPPQHRTRRRSGRGDARRHCRRTLAAKPAAGRRGAARRASAAAPRCLGRVAEAGVGQAPDGVEGLRGLRPRGPHHDLVAAAHSQRGHGVQAAGAHRPAAGGEVGDGHLGVEARRRAHEQRRRPRVEPQAVRHDEPQSGRASGRLGAASGSAAPRRRLPAAPDVRRLRRPAAPACAALAASPPRASAATASREPPSAAATAAATAPSTNGAAVSSDARRAAPAAAGRGPSPPRARRCPGP